MALAPEPTGVGGAVFFTGVSEGAAGNWALTGQGIIAMPPIAIIMAYLSAILIVKPSSFPPRLALLLDGLNRRKFYRFSPSPAGGWLSRHNHPCRRL
jgi:hypothetical protein